MDKLVDDLAEAKAKTVSNTLSDVKEEALAKNFADTLAQEEARTVSQAVSEVQAKVLMHQLPFILLESKAKTLGDTLSDMEAKALVDTLANPSIRSCGQKTLQNTAQCLSDHFPNTLAEGKAEAIVTE